jgi:hypothetical protein
MKTKKDSISPVKNDESAPLASESSNLAPVSGESTLSREQRIAEIAYFRAEQRGFEPGDDIRDWLDAEAEVKSREAASGGMN